MQMTGIPFGITDWSQVEVADETEPHRSYTAVVRSSSSSTERASLQGARYPETDS
jgi:hypothetical protein